MVAQLDFPQVVAVEFANSVVAQLTYSFTGVDMRIDSVSR